MSDTTVGSDTPIVRRKGRKPLNRANGVSKGHVKGSRKPLKAATARSRKPTTAKLGLDPYGFRKGTLKSQAAAMYASKKGATMLEVKNKLDSTQLNLLTDLEKKGFKVTKLKEAGPGTREVTRYFLRAK